MTFSGNTLPQLGIDLISFVGKCLALGCNHFAIAFGLLELFVQEYVVPWPLFSDITAIVIPRYVTFVVVVLTMLQVLWSGYLT